MNSSLYVALSGQLALEHRLATIANNVANAGSVGFRAEGVHFESLIARTPGFATAFADAGTDFAVKSAGSLRRTGNALDVAVQGDGFLGIQTPAGIAYTRDGRMQMLPTGEIVSMNGHPVLDVSGAPLLADPAGPAVSIGRDGMISQGARRVGAIGLFRLDLATGYQRYENSGFLPGGPVEAIVEFGNDGVVQGFVEEANVNPVLELTNLIRVTRAFESLASAVEQSDSAMKSAIQTLAGRG